MGPVDGAERRTEQGRAEVGEQVKGPSSAMRQVRGHATGSGAHGSKWSIHWLFECSSYQGSAWVTLPPASPPSTLHTWPVGTGCSLKSLGVMLRMQEAKRGFAFPFSLSLFPTVPRAKLPCFSLFSAQLIYIQPLHPLQKCFCPLSNRKLLL